MEIRGADVVRAKPVTGLVEPCFRPIPYHPCFYSVSESVVRGLLCRPLPVVNAEHRCLGQPK
jgi:hypothetical protein